jgi:HK97 family phage major capsid protein
MNLHIFDGEAESIDRTGADALIPVQESREIVQGIIAQSAVLSRGRRLQNMTARQYKVPVLDMLPVAYFVNGDSGQKKTTKMQWDKKFLVAEEIAVIVPIPEAVLDDAEYDIWGEVRPRLQEAFGKVIDGAVLFGTNKPTSWRAGIVATATTAGNVVTLPAAGGTKDLYDVIMGEDGVIAKVEEDGYFVNGHLGDISMRAKLRGLRDEQGQPLFKSDMQTGTNYTLDGSGITFPNNGAFDKTAALMISGDFSQLVYSIRQDLTYKIFTEGVVQNPDGSIAYNLMQNDMVALRAVMRLGWEIPNPINALQPTAAVRCPFAILTQGTAQGNTQEGNQGN